MKTFDLIRAAISYNLKDPHSKALEPDCLSSSAFNYDTVSKGRGRSTELTALSVSNGLPGKVVSFYMVPLAPPIPLGRDGAVAGQDPAGMLRSFISGTFNIFEIRNLCVLRARIHCKRMLSIKLK